jgi:uncharacterized 2Fe-2S/4Fe-4S cluster protein (DUF4445 family)
LGLWNTAYRGLTNEAYIVPLRDRFHLDITTIQRSNFPSEVEEVSSAADFSPERVQESMIQGVKTRGKLFAGKRVTMPQSPI